MTSQHPFVMVTHKSVKKSHPNLYLYYPNIFSLLFVLIKVANVGQKTSGRLAKCITLFKNVRVNFVELSNCLQSFGKDLANSCPMYGKITSKLIELAHVDRSVLVINIFIRKVVIC